MLLTETHSTGSLDPRENFFFKKPTKTLSDYATFMHLQRGVWNTKLLNFNSCRSHREAYVNPFYLFVYSTSSETFRFPPKAFSYSYTKHFRQKEEKFCDYLWQWKVLFNSSFHPRSYIFPIHFLFPLDMWAHFPHISSSSISHHAVSIVSLVFLLLQCCCPRLNFFFFAVFRFCLFIYLFRSLANAEHGES